MHPRNRYRQPPDFDALAQSYPALRKYLNGHTIDFQNDAAQRCLTQALLHRDFGLSIKLPEDRLCPPVPNRLNYVLWIQDIVNTHRLVFSSDAEHLLVRGLDIGTGASAIYPLLACALEPKWQFIATEIDPVSFSHAETNVASNNLMAKIAVVKVEDCGHDASNANKQNFGFDRLFSQDYRMERADQRDVPSSCNTGPTIKIEFTMCNPPFYGSAEEIAHSEEAKEAGPMAVCTGAPVEMITTGGEVQFILQMVRESVALGEMEGGSFQCRSESSQADPPANGGQDSDDYPKKRRRMEDYLITGINPSPTGQSESEVSSRWYTSMLGKLSSVVDVVQEFKNLGITNYAVTEFVQGHTRRWAVGWSLDWFRLPDTVSRIDNSNSALQRLMPPRNTLWFPYPTTPSGNLAPDSTPNPKGSETGTLPIPASLSSHLRRILSSIEGAILRDANYNPSGQVAAGRNREEHDESQHDNTLFTTLVTRDTWSRTARRKRVRTELGLELKTGGGSTSGLALIAMGCGIRWQYGGFEFQWLYGRDRGLFESFVNHVVRKVGVGRVEVESR